MKEKRSVYADVIKGIGIILVVAGHNIQFGSGRACFDNGLFYDNLLFKFIYAFHMPLFMLISGYFFYNTYKRNRTSEIASKRFWGILVPILVWTFVHFAVIVLRALKNGEPLGLLRLIRIYFESLVYNWWFLWALLLYSMLMILLQRSGKWKIPLAVLIIACTLLTPDAFSFNCYKYCFPYYVLGYYWNEHRQWSDRYEKVSRQYRMGIFILDSVLFCGMLCFVRKETYVYTTGVSLLHRNAVQQFQTDLFRWILGIVGCIWVFLLVELLMHRTEDSRLWNRLAQLGRDTLGIYIISGLLENYVLLKITGRLHFNVGILFAETVAVIAACLVCIRLLRRSAAGKKYFLGEN